MSDTNVSEQLLHGLNNEQREAVSTLNGPLLIVAGPGSGKTRVLTHRFAALTAAGVAPWHIVCVTFTNKAAAQMRERIAQLTSPETAGRSTVATFHATCVRLLRTYHDSAGLPRSFTIVDSDDSARIIKAIATDAGYLAGLSPSEVKETLKTFSSRISAGKNSGLTPEAMAHTYPDAAMTAHVWAAYNERLQAMGTVDFDDLLLRTTHLLERNEPVRANVQQKFQYVMVDEYQDTNAIQEKLLGLWNGTGNVCVVGDPDQSIYAFRGAAPAVMDRFVRNYPGTKVVTLDRNYRSTGNICAVSAAIIASNPAELRARTHTQASSGAKVDVRAFADSDSEARWVVQQIDARRPLKENAVLIRTAALSRPVENSLRKAGLAYQLTGGMSFFERSEIKDVLAWLTFAYNPRDEVAFARAVTSPKRGIGASTIAAVSEAARAGAKPISEICADGDNVPARAREKLTQFAQTVQSIASTFSDGALAAVRAAVVLSGVREAVIALDAKDGTDRLANLDQLLAQASSFDQDPAQTDSMGQLTVNLPAGERVEAFLHSTALVSATDSEDDTSDAVQVMTIHAAKGKEFDHVYVVGLEENILPHHRALRSGLEEELFEERRLAFVAASRARKTLALTYSASRFFFGEETTNEPSRFLTGLPSHSVQESEQWRTHSQGSLNRYAHTTGSRRGAIPKQVTVRRKTSVPQPSTGNAGEFTTGDRVQHSFFGTGRVIAAQGVTVTVAFDNHSVAKVLDVTVAPLVREDTQH